jgi:hypothetical protein
MTSTFRFAGLLSLVLAVHLVGCADDNLNGLRPELIITPGNPIDGVDHYVLDFGDVDVGTTVSRSVTISDVSLVKLTLQPTQIAAPFGTVISDVQVIEPHDTLVIGFTYKPAEPGPSTTSVTLVSDSSDAGVLNRIIDLKGTGVVAPPPVCTFTVSPMAIDFGSVEAGQTKTSGVRITNTGTAACTGTAAIAASSSTAFTLASGQSSQLSVPVGSSIPVGVTFAPTMSNASYAGTLNLVVAGTPMAIPLSGMSPAPPAPCTYSVTPTSIYFGVVSIGTMKTSGVVVKNTGSSTPCSISNVAIAAGSNSAFTLAAGQATSETLAAGASTNLDVTFSPLDASMSYQGTLTFVITPGTTVSVPLSGATPGGCPHPNANGTCGTATAPLYVNSNTTLYTFEPATHTVTFVSNFSGNLDDIWDIAIDTNGVLLGSGSTGTLYTINVGTGACMSVGFNGIGANAMTVTIDNQIVVAGGGDVEVLDRATYGVSQTLVSGSSYTSSGDIVALPDGYLYWSVTGSGHDRLVKIDRMTGATSVVGTLPDSAVWGLAYAANMLFGFSNDGKYLVIDSTNGTGTTGSTPDLWYGATSNPVTW